uniref:DUF2442 domain-containing protein n=1 Tax=Candidatus Kentrum sp. UNK TaxID=2126344 RepID=A0A451AJC2_9GAMM|nr:MAG: Protein of unknown function (DUF2442) [Candidatus Kentron sp. UNK]VFK71756.1 MAG: Protein of unknown function (DUF2442) [Candidatus Kentron sp. UNK]
MKKIHKVENARIEKGVLSLRVDGIDIRRNLNELSSTLANAKEAEQKAFEISPSGYGIHWPLIDEDISIDGLLSSSDSSVPGQFDSRSI